MSLRKKDKYGRVNTDISDNLSAPNNPSHNVDEHTNFVLRTITLENLDECIYRTFHNKFTIANEPVELILLDAEIASLRNDHPDKFDDFTEYLKLPYFTCWRTNDEMLFRTNPSYKKVIYVEPVQKAQGVVYNEYITKAPKFLKVFYTIKFITTLREYANQYEEQMLKYFENKRVVVTLDREKFHLQAADPLKICTLEVTKRGDTGKNYYTLTSDLELWAYIRDSKDVQKRERPNKFTFSIVEKSRDSAILIEEATVDLSEQKTNNVFHPIQKDEDYEVLDYKPGY